MKVEHMNYFEVGKSIEKNLEERESILIYKHIDKVIVTSADFTDDKKFRYKLEVKLKTRNNGKVVCVVMQNPSYASEDIADKSVNFLEKLIFEKEYNEFSDVYKMIIVNQYAYIQTNGFKATEEQIGEKNNQVIENSINESDIILLAWGKSNSFTDRITFVNNVLKEKQNINKKRYITKKHPSRGSYLNFIDSYKKTIGKN